MQPSQQAAAPASASAEAGAGARAGGPRGAPARLLRVARAAAWAANIVAVAALALTAAILIYEIIARFVFNRPTGWSDVAAAYLMPAMVFMGAAYALLHDAHIRIDTLHVRLWRPGRRWVALFNETVGLAALCALVWFTILMVDRVRTGEVKATAGAFIFPEWWPQVLVPVGLAVMTFAQLVLWLYTLMAILRPGDYPDGADAALLRTEEPLA